MKLAMQRFHSSSSLHASVYCCVLLAAVIFSPLGRADFAPTDPSQCPRLTETPEYQQIAAAYKQADVQHGDAYNRCNQKRNNAEILGCMNRADTVFVDTYSALGKQGKSLEAEFNQKHAQCVTVAQQNKERSEFLKKAAEQERQNQELQQQRQQEAYNRQKASEKAAVDAYNQRAQEQQRQAAAQQQAQYQAQRARQQAEAQRQQAIQAAQAQQRQALNNIQSDLQSRSIAQSSQDANGRLSAANAERDRLIASSGSTNGTLAAQIAELQAAKQRAQGQVAEVKAALNLETPQQEEQPTLIRRDIRDDNGRSSSSGGAASAALGELASSKTPSTDRSQECEAAVQKILKVPALPQSNDVVALQETLMYRADQAQQMLDRDCPGASNYASLTANIIGRKQEAENSCNWAGKGLGQICMPRNHF